eukprot:3442605-Prymnesium_polylepis.1
MEDVDVAIGDAIDVKVTQINLDKGQYRVVPTSKVTVKPSEGGGGGGGAGGGAAAAAVGVAAATAAGGSCRGGGTRRRPPNEARSSRGDRAHGSSKQRRRACSIPRGLTHSVAPFRRRLVAPQCTRNGLLALARSILAGIQHGVDGSEQSETAVCALTAAESG